MGRFRSEGNWTTDADSGGVSPKKVELDIREIKKGRIRNRMRPNYVAYFISLRRSAMVMPSKNSSIILSSFSHMGRALQHSAREQAEAP